MEQADPGDVVESRNSITNQERSRNWIFECDFLIASLPGGAAIRESE